MEDLLKNGIHNEKFAVTNMIRLGMKPDMCSKKPRPLLIKFDEEHHSRKVLSGAVALKYCNNWMKKVGISPQLSKEELEVERT